MSKGISDPNHPLKDIPNGTIVHRRDDSMFTMRKRDVRSLWRAKVEPTDPDKVGMTWKPGFGYVLARYRGEVLRELRALRGVGPVSYLSNRQ